MKIYGLLLLLLLCLACKPDLQENEFKVVSTCLLSDEILIHLLPQQQIAAFSSLATNPQYSVLAGREELRNKPLLSISQTEQIIALKPSLVLAASWADPSAIANLKKFGIKVELLNSPTNFEQAYTVVQQVGQLTNAQEQAINLMNLYKTKELQLIFKANQIAKKFSLIHYANPDAVGNRNTSIGYIINQAGFINAADQLTESSPYGFYSLNLEQLLLLNPDYIYLGNQDPTIFITSNPVTKQLKAVQNGHLISLPLQDSLAVESVSLYMIEGALALQKAVYG